MQPCPSHGSHSSESSQHCTFSLISGTLDAFLTQTDFHNFIPLHTFFSLSGILCFSKLLNLYPSKIHCVCHHVCHLPQISTGIEPLSPVRPWPAEQPVAPLSHYTESSPPRDRSQVLGVPGTWHRACHRAETGWCGKVGQPVHRLPAPQVSPLPLCLSQSPHCSRAACCPVGPQGSLSEAALTTRYLVL